MKQIWVIANWKANKNIKEALEWVSKVGPSVPKNDKLKVVVCPTFISLEQVAKEVKVGGYNLMVGSQDLSAFGQGAYTGEVSAALLSGLVSLSILGHCERRRNFGETEGIVAGKVKQAKAAGITPLVCVQEENTAVPEGCQLIAYEPVDAISTGLTNTPGSGKADNPDEANRIASGFKQKLGEGMEVLYGGSVNSENVRDFITKQFIDGVLVGNASLDAEEFVKIMKECVVETT